MSMALEGLSNEIFLSRYAAPNETTWEDCAKRVAKTISQIEKNGNIEKYEKIFFEKINNGDFMPGGRILFGAGRPKFNMLNCYSLGIDDSVESIGQMIKDSYLISCAGGGIGYNFSKIRPKGDDIQNIKNSAPGAVSVMQMVNEIGNHVRSGKNRRTALIAILNVDHPDLLEFLHVKLSLNQLTNFNISIGITNDFIKAVSKDKPWTFKFNGREYKIFKMERWDNNTKVDEIEVPALSMEDALLRGQQHHRINQNTIFKNIHVVELRAKSIWDLMIQNSWKSGDPGIYNIDLANSLTNVSYFENVPNPNPCGEIPLPPYGNCCLGHVNLSNMYDKEKNDVDWKKFASTIRTGIRFLDNVLSANHYPIPECKVVGEKSRRIGLGVTGLHYLLLKLGYRYGDQKCLEFLDRLFATFRNEAYITSIELAKEKGSFPAFNAEKFSEEGFFKQLPPRIQTAIKKYGIRNAVMLTIAPCGCQTPDTMIVAQDGIMRLDEIMDINGPQWQKLDKIIAQDIKYEHASRSYVNGNAPIKNIKLDSGIELNCTPNHKYRVLDNGEYLWRSANELKPNDKIVVRIGGYNNTFNQKLIINNSNMPNELTPKFAELLGLIYSDGSIHERSVRIHCENEKSFLKYVTNLIQDVLNITPCLNIHSNSDKCVSVSINSVDFLSFLKENNLIKQKALEVSIPLLVRKSSCESLMSFIHGYWLGDGSQTGDTRYIDTGSKRMSQDLAICLRALGQNIRIQEYSDVQGSYSSNTKYRVYFKGAGSRNFDGYRYVKKSIKNDISDVRKFGDELYLDAVTNITDSVGLTLDIEVPNNHTYLANSVISHNTNSMVLGVSSGVEPIFAPIYERSFREGNVWKKEVVIDKLFETFYHDHRTSSHFVAAYDISVEEHIAVQATIQKYIDSAISKTTNIPEDYPVDKLSDIILDYAPHVKGFTIYRTNSRGLEPLKPIRFKSREELKILMDKIHGNDAESLSSCQSGVCEFVPNK